MDEPSKTRFYVFCSDRPRNGKTLLCRLFCGSVPDVESGSFRVFDTEYPEGHISRMFPANSEVIDFTKTSGRVRLFDSVLEAANRYALIDLQSNLLNEFFSTYSDIGFDEEAYRQSVHVVVYYVLDKSYRSLERAHEIYEKINHGQFFLVENEAIGKPNLRDVSSPIQHMLSRIRILRFPLLSAGLIDVLEDPGFSLFDFMAGQNQSIEYDCQLELWNLLEFFYQQRAPDKEGITHFL